MQGNKMQHQTYFNELSISSIKQKNNADSSIDFEQEKLLFNQINHPCSELTDEYGLCKPISAKGFIKKIQDDNPIKLFRGKSRSRLQNLQFQQKNLCFNKQLKRKKLKSQSKQKIAQPSTQLCTSGSLKQLKLTKNNYHKLSSKKNSQQESAISNAKIMEINTRNFAKAPRIALKIYEEPLIIDKSGNFNECVKRIYHQMPDQIKFQLNDLNHNFNIYSDSRQSNFHRVAQKKRNPSMFNYLKRSFFSKAQYNNKKQQNSWMNINSGSQKVVQVNRPLSLDCKNSSFYSSRTQHYQSPISKDSSSTATRRIVKRSQIFTSQPSKQQQYFSRTCNTRHK